MSWCIQYELLYLQNRTTKKYTRENGNKYLKFSYINKKKVTISIIKLWKGLFIK